MSHGYTMDDFRAEMRRRGVYKNTRPRQRRVRDTTKLIAVWKTVLPTTDGHTFTKRPRVMGHGNAIVNIVPCGVHPLHLVKVRASGARSGCPMCEMQIEDLCRRWSPRTAP